MKAAERRLGKGRNQMYGIKKPDRELTYNNSEINKVVEDFYWDLNNLEEQPRT